MSFKIFLKYLRLGIAGMTAFVWWCIFYPDLCFPQDTYEVVYEAQEDSEDDLERTDGSGKSEEADLYSLLQAEEDQIVIKSRLLEWIKQYTKE